MIRDLDAQNKILKLFGIVTDITSGTTPPLAPVSDINASSPMRNQTLEVAQFRVVQGTILDEAPADYCYRVAVAGGQEPYSCVLGDICGAVSIGMRDARVFESGTAVLVAVNDMSSIGFILCAIPQENAYGSMRLASMNTEVSRVWADATDTSVQDLQTEDEQITGVYDFSPFKALDNIDVGAFCVLAPTGVKLFADPFMTTISTSDYTGLWVYSDDELVRLSGTNVQIRTSGMESDLFNDNGEYLSYQGIAAYAYEQLGFYKHPEEPVVTENSSDVWQGDKKYTASLDVLDYKTKPFHRDVVYKGYLGQVEYMEVLIPPQQSSDTTIKYGGKDDSECVSRIMRHSDGLITLESTKGVVIAKRGAIPAVTRSQRPDELTSDGDDKDNYDFTGKNRKITGDVANSEAINACMQKVMGLIDFSAYVFNYKGLQPFLYHAKDYACPEERLLTTKTQAVPDFTSLASYQLLKSSEPVLKDVNENMKRQRYYEDNAAIFFTDEGDLVLQAGGCEIRMAKGTLTMSAPGDIVQHSGRDMLHWAGRDYSLRAKSHMDISSTKEDIRIKAERNLEVLAANEGGNYGLLLESKGSGQIDYSKVGTDIKTSGIIMKATEDRVAIVGSGLYLRAGVSDDDVGTGIMLDSGKGGQDITMLGRQIKQYVATGNNYDIAFMDFAGEAAQTVVRLSENELTLPGDIRSKGQAVLGGAVVIGGDVRARGDYFTVKAKMNPMYHPLAILEEAIDVPTEQVVSILTDKYPEAKSKEYEQQIRKQFYDSGCIGYNMDQIAFSFRTDDQYPLTEFCVYQDLWQNIAENTGQTLGTWEETKVTTQSTETCPYPGKKRLLDDECYVTQTSTLFDYRQGYNKDRWNKDKPTDGYADPKYGKQEKKKLSKYTVIQ